MATRQQTATRRADGRQANGKGRRPGAAEPLPARALQLALLLGGMTLLFTAFLGGRWGPLATGVLILSSAFPPLRRHVDRWTVGKARGEEAEQAALMRLVVGIGVVALALLGALAL